MVKGSLRVIFDLAEGVGVRYRKRMKGRNFLRINKRQFVAELESGRRRAGVILIHLDS